MTSIRPFILLSALSLCSVIYADNITFADNNVKVLCVQNWDDDNDGELSTEEASMVTTLGNVFRGNKTIVSFEELAYFTGLTTINDYAFYQSSIQVVSFPQSVTTIGKYAFSESSIRGELHIPGTVKTIEDFAFYSCKQLTGVFLKEGVETAGWHSFSGPIRTLSLPSTLTFMSSMVVDPYVNAEPSAGVFVPEGDLYVYSHAIIPAAINDFAFYYVFGDSHLVVPYGAVEAYKAESGWSCFGEYLEFGDVNMDGEVDVADAVCIVNRVIGKPTPKFLEGAADANNDGEIDIADAVRIINWIIGKTDNNSSPIGHDEEDPIEPQ